MSNEELERLDDEIADLVERLRLLRQRRGTLRNRWKPPLLAKLKRAYLGDQRMEEICTDFDTSRGVIMRFAALYNWPYRRRPADAVRTVSP